MDDQNPKPQRLLRAAEVYDRTALSRASVWRRVRAGTFPKSVTLAYNRIAWFESDIDAWLESQRSNPPAPPRKAADEGKAS